MQYALGMAVGRIAHNNALGVIAHNREDGESQ